ncbi:hypothetical protein PWT90_03471 [Aphanocladium album]|nr:hypothetical protein PWT90_03471 [Aphanocladium album]
MKFSILVATAITTAVLAAEEHLDIRSCVCSSAKGSCHCDDIVKTVQVLSDVVPSCIAARGWQDTEEPVYADNSCGHARRFADVMCSRGMPAKPFPTDPCGAVHKFAENECSLRKRSPDEFYATETCTTAQKRATMCLRAVEMDPGHPGDWCGMHLAEVEEHCDIAMGGKGEDSRPHDPCGRRRCARERSPEAPRPPDMCGHGRCAKKRNAATPFPPLPHDVCGRRRCAAARSSEPLCGPSLRMARACRRTAEKRDAALGVREGGDGYPGNMCGHELQRATECVKAQGWLKLPWDVCGSEDEDCVAAAKRDLGYHMEVKRDPVESAAACEFSSRGSRRAVAPPHCMCSVERGESVGDAVKRCRCGGEEDAQEVPGSQYHCMCLTGEGDATAPCSCNSDVAFLSKVQYE